MKKKQQSSRVTVPVPNPAGPRNNRPWDKKKAKQGLGAKPISTTFFASCVDRNEGPGVNDFVIKVTCEASLKDSFADTWNACQDKVDQAEDYSVNDIYALMGVKGYKVTGLHTEFIVGF